MAYRGIRQQVARSRAYRNMHAVNRMSKRETYLRGIGQGVIFLLIGCVILGLNMQKIGNPSITFDFQSIPAWAQVLGGGIASFGLCWAIRDAWLFASLARIGARMSADGKSPDESTN